MGVLKRTATVAGSLFVLLVATVAAAGESDVVRASLVHRELSNVEKLQEILTPKTSDQMAEYSYCGACTKHEDCGSGNQCCTGDCPDGKKKCYQVDNCSNRR